MNKIKISLCLVMAKVSRILYLVQRIVSGQGVVVPKTLVALASCIVAFILYLGAVDQLLMALRQVTWLFLRHY